MFALDAVKLPASFETRLAAFAVGVLRNSPECSGGDSLHHLRANPTHFDGDGVGLQVIVSEFMGFPNFIKGSLALVFMVVIFWDEPRGLVGFGLAH